MKFTLEGAVTLEVLWRPGRQAGDLEIAVRDTGPGIDATQLGKLFKPFEQLSASTARTHGGTGLGLTISRRLAQAMRGQLTVESRVGHGSRFILALPLALCESSATTDAEKADAALRVLVADDHPVNRQAARLILEPLVHELVCVEDGAQALAVLSERSFDLIILDIHMPVMDGVETARAIRLQPGPNRDTPLMALTGAVSEPEIALCREAGFASVAAKPIQVREVIAAMNQALSRTAQAG